MNRLCGLVCGLSILSGGAAAAWGQDAPDYAPSTGEPITSPEVRSGATDWQPRSRIGTALMLNGGLGDFSDSSVRDATGMAGSWGLRLVSGTRVPLAAELGYFGGVNDINAPGVDGDGYLLHNGAEGALRFNVPFIGRNGHVAPFVIGGLGWARYNLMDADAAGGLSSTDDQLVVPLGGGLSGSYRGFTAEARFTYRLAYEDTLFSGNNDMSGWNMALGLGAEF
jgi:hypothetical protein